VSGTQETVQELLNSVPLWYHTIEVAPGVVTPGFRKDSGMRAMWEWLRMPDVSGKTVLDINTWDGGYAFEAERRGAASVTALDFYIWAMDLAEHGKHRRECLEKHETPLPYHKMPYWKPDKLPGKPSLRSRSFSSFGLLVPLPGARGGTEEIDSRDGRWDTFRRPQRAPFRPSAMAFAIAPSYRSRSASRPLALLGRLICPRACASDSMCGIDASTALRRDRKRWLLVTCVPVALENTSTR
jgi:hypothetical protein